MKPLYALLAYSTPRHTTAEEAILAVKTRMEEEGRPFHKYIYQVIGASEKLKGDEVFGSEGPRSIEPSFETEQSARALFDHKMKRWGVLDPPLLLVKIIGQVRFVVTTELAE